MQKKILKDRDRDSFMYGYIYWTSQKAAIFQHTIVLLFENVFLLYPMQQVIYNNYFITLKKDLGLM